MLSVAFRVRKLAIGGVAIFQGIAQSGFETHEKFVVTHLNGPE